MEENILLDSFCITGNGKDFLCQTARMLDDSTEVEQVDLQMSYMYHYVDTDADGVATFARFIPGDEYISYDHKSGDIKANLVDVRIDAHDFPGQLLNEIESNPEDNGLTFVFDPEGRLDKPYTVSKYLSHTATARFGHMFNTYDIVSAMSLATMLGEMDRGTEIYAVSRKVGKAHKLVGFFGTDCRRSLVDLVQELTSKPCHVYDVKATQCGFSFVIGYYDEAEMLDGFPMVDKEGYTPCFIVSTSDTGFRSDTISAAWMDHAGQVMVIDTKPIGDSPLETVESLIESHKSTAELINKGYQIREYFPTADEFVDYVKDAIAGIGGEDLGKKTLAALCDYMEEDYKTRKKLQKSSLVRYSLSEVAMLLTKGLAEVTQSSPDYKKEKVNKFLGAFLTNMDVKKSQFEPSGISRKFYDFDEFASCIDWGTELADIKLDETARMAVLEDIKTRYSVIRRIQRMSYVQMDMARIANILSSVIRNVTGKKIDRTNLLMKMLNEAEAETA